MALLNLGWLKIHKANSRDCTTATNKYVQALAQKQNTCKACIEPINTSQEFA